MGARIAILASGAGTTAQSLIDASAKGELGSGEISLVISDRQDAEVLRRAESAGVEGRFVDPGGLDRAGYGKLLAEELRGAGVDFVCLAGFMRILDHRFVEEFSGRLVNTHPSLLPAFPGAHPVRDALQYGAQVTGATVHFVDEGVDTGPVIFQEAVSVLDEDDEATLHERIKEVERRLYPKAVRAVVSGRTRIEGRRVVVTPEAGA